MVNIISELLEIGFTEYEAKAYFVLLKQNVASATEITKIGNIPRGRVYDILKLLIEKGFCITVPGTIKKFKAVDPEIAIHNLIELQKKKEQKMKETAIKLQEVFNNQKDTSTHLDYIHVLTSKPSMIKKFHDLGNNAKEIVRSFNKAPYAVPFEIESIKRDSESLVESFNKGTISKALFEIEKDNQDQFIDILQIYVDLGEEIRVCDHLPIKMLISDNNAVMISLRNNGTSKFKLTSMIVEHSDLTDALIELFDIYWAKAMTFDMFKKKYENK